MIGKQIQRYEITDHLGTGAVAEVYLARQVLHNEIVAIKLFRPELCIPDPEWAGRFYRDAEIATGLRHPGVMRALDAGKDGDRFYLVLEYVEGAGLRDIVGLRGRLPAAHAMRLARGVAAGLDYLHARGVTHANLTSANVLIRNSDGAPVIADFSIFRSVWHPEYAAPEQAAGGAVGPAADMFSLGVILYEMLIGRVPYFGELPPAAAMRHDAYRQRAVRDVESAAGAHAAAVIERLLAPDPDRRFASGSEIIEAIDTPAIAAPQQPPVAFEQPAARPAFRAAPLVPELTHIPARAARYDTRDDSVQGVRMLGIWATGILGLFIVAAAIFLMVRSGPQRLLLPGVNQPVEKYDEEDENTRAANIRPGLPTTERSDVPADDASAKKSGEEDLPDEDENVQELITIDEETVDTEEPAGTEDELFGGAPAATTPGADAAAGDKPPDDTGAPGTAPGTPPSGASPPGASGAPPPNTTQPQPPAAPDQGNTF